MGGGGCQWKLSEVTIGIEYATTEHIINSAEIGTAVGFRIAFDEEADPAQDNTLATNPFTLSPTYYPVIREWGPPENKTTLSLFGWVNIDSYRMEIGNTENAKITFAPIVDEAKVVKMVAPDIHKQEGRGWRIEYPDGSVTWGSETLSFKKVQAIP
jgi:hypothetical protein